MAGVLQDAGTHGGCLTRCRNSWRMSYKMLELTTGVLQDVGTHGGCHTRCIDSRRVSYKMQALSAGVLQDAWPHGGCLARCRNFLPFHHVLCVCVPPPPPHLFFFVLCLLCLILPVSLHCLFLIAPSVLINIYCNVHFRLPIFHINWQI
jgi:hypothetical protein